MHKKKEIIIVALIVITTIILSSLPLIRCSKPDVSHTKESMFINITIKGEIIAEDDGDTMTILVKKGSSYQEIINLIEIHLTKYSILSSDITKRYFIDSTISISSSYIPKTIIENNDNKININTAEYDQLVKLYGVKAKRANSIIEYRKNKKIESFEELKKLIGVSDEVIEYIKEKAFLQ